MAGGGSVGDRLDELDLAIFDKDGTLIDFDAMWSGWVIDLADRLESAVGGPIRDQLYATIGFDPGSGRARPGGPLAAMPMARLRGLTLDVVGAVTGSRADAERAVARAWEAPDPITLAHPLTNLPLLFGRLRAKGLGIAVATSDDRAPTEATLAGLDVRSLIDAVVCADDGLPVKPAPAMVLHLCRTLGVDPARSVMIGDAQADLAMGRAAGVGLRIGVLSGVGTRQDLEPLADAIIPSIGDLLEG